MDGLTALKDIDIPHLDVVLDEIFHVPPAVIFPELHRPLTVQDLAQRSGRDLGLVIRQLAEIRLMSDAVEISPTELQEKLAADPSQVLLIDVREPWEFEVCHIEGSVLLATTGLEAIKAKLTAPLIVTVCHHGVRSYSAAMYFRQQNLAQARSLAGGVDVWAQTVDRGMPRY